MNVDDLLPTPKPFHEHGPDCSTCREYEQRELDRSIQRAERRLREIEKQRKLGIVR